MALVRHLYDPALLSRAQAALGMSQEALGHLLGHSRRTIIRWQAGRSGPQIDQWHALARHAYPLNRAIAEEIARETGETLVSLGLESPPVSPAPPSASLRPVPSARDLADSIVCAAAEAAATTPQAMRPAILAAFDRAASVGLAVDEVCEALKPARRPRRR